MTRILTYSIPKEDEDILEWLAQKRDKSGLVRQGLRLLMNQEVKDTAQLDRIEGKQDTGLDKQDEALGILRVLQGRKPG